MTASQPARAGTARAPLVDRIADGACAGFALFTLCAHALGLLGGDLVELAIASGAAWAGALAWSARRRSVGDGPAGAALPLARELPRALRAVAVAAGVAVPLALAGRPVALWWSGLALLFPGAAAALAPPHADAGAAVPGRRQSALLLLLAGAGATLALVCHRYAIDDSFYVSVATAAADHPGRALLSWDPLHADPGLPLHNPIHRIHTFELLHGVVSWLTGIPAIASFHGLAAAAGGALVPLCLARPLRELLPAAWLPALVGALVFLVANGDTNTSYGNYAFTRMWQGKAFLLYVWLPLVTAHALRFAARPTRAGFLWLLAAQVASVGASSTAIWLAPLCAGVALVANAPWRPRPGAALLRVAGGCAASLYPLLVGLAMKATMTGVVPADPVTAPLGEPLARAIAAVVGGPRFAGLGLAALLSTWALLPVGSGRRYAAAAPLLVWGLLLAPDLAQFLRDHVTGPATWRALWALPVPLLTGMALAAPLAWPLRGWGRAAARAAWGAALLLLALWVPIRTTVQSGPGVPPFVNRVTVGWPGLKVDPDAYAAAATLASLLPEDAAVIAPERVARWIPTFHHAPRPLLVRAVYLRVQQRNLPPGAYRQRVLAAQFASGESERREAARAFGRVLADHDVRGVCLALAAPDAARRILERRGFARRSADRFYEIWTGPPPGEGPAPGD